MVQTYVLQGLAVIQMIAIQAVATSPGGIAQKPVLTQDVSIKTCNFTSYTALGDSYACGFGAQQRLRLCQPGEKDGTADCTTEGCGKDTGGYPYLFWQQHKIGNFQYLACNGNDTGSVLDSQVKSSAFGTPDLVTINVGGDDQSFFRMVAEACLDPRTYVSSKCDGEIKKAKGIIGGQGEPVGKIFNAIKMVTQNRATVVVMSYARLFYTGERPWYCFLPASDSQFKDINGLATSLNDMLEKAATAAQFKFVNVDGMFSGHRYCETADPTSYYFQLREASGQDTGGAQYTEFSLAHPTLEAIQKTYLSELNRVLGC